MVRVVATMQTYTTRAAGLGSIVKVADRFGRSSEYELIGPSERHEARERVTLDSPVGHALLGARPGDYVRVTMSNGRQRRVRVMDVIPRSPGSLHAALEAGVAAA